MVRTVEEFSGVSDCDFMDQIGEMRMLGTISTSGTRIDEQSSIYGNLGHGANICKLPKIINAKLTPGILN